MPEKYIHDNSRGWRCMLVYGKSTMYVLGVRDLAWSGGLGAVRVNASNYLNNVPLHNQMVNKTGLSGM